MYHKSEDILAVLVDEVGTSRSDQSSPAIKNVQHRRSLWKKAKISKSQVWVGWLGFYGTFGTKRPYHAYEGVKYL